MSEVHSRDEPESAENNSRSEITEDAIPPPEEDASPEDSEDYTEEEDPEESPDEEDAAPRNRSSKKIRKKALLRILRNVCVWLTVATAAVALTVHFFFPVMRIYGSSMSSTLVDGDIVIARKTTNLERGDICTFYYGEQILCKRVIGIAGDSIEIEKDGTVYVNGAKLDEPYLKGKSLGQCEITFPYIVPENSYFVLGDNRRMSIDSRHDTIGCVAKDKVVGKLIFCILPLPSFGTVR